MICGVCHIFIRVATRYRHSICGEDLVEMTKHGRQVMNIARRQGVVVTEL